jgi:hypothetical protein
MQDWSINTKELWSLTLFVYVMAYVLQILVNNRLEGFDVTENAVLRLVQRNSHSGHIVMRRSRQRQVRSQTPKPPNSEGKKRKRGRQNGYDDYDEDYPTNGKY